MLSVICKTIRNEKRQYFGYKLIGEFMIFVFFSPILNFALTLYFP